MHGEAMWREYIWLEVGDLMEAQAEDIKASIREATILGTVGFHESCDLMNMRWLSLRCVPYLRQDKWLLTSGYCLLTLDS